MTRIQQPEKKLIIDEDWKSQVEAEKEAARQAEEPPRIGRAAVGRPAPRPAAAGQSRIPGEHALLARGHGPGPVAQSRNQKGRSPTRSGQALHRPAGVLQQKTEGNRTPEESQELEAAAARIAAGLRSAQKKWSIGPQATVRSLISLTYRIQAQDGLPPLPQVAAACRDSMAAVKNPMPALARSAWGCRAAPIEQRFETEPSSNCDPAGATCHRSTAPISGTAICPSADRFPPATM